MPGGSAADGMDHRIFAFQRIPLGHGQLRGEVLREAFALRFQRCRAHILCRRVHKVADQAHSARFGEGLVDLLDRFGQQDPRSAAVLVCLVPRKLVLRRLPPVHRRTRDGAVGQPVCPGRQRLRQLRQAPARQALRIGHAAQGEPLVTIGHDRGLVALAGEALRFQHRPLARLQRLGPTGEPVTIDQVYRNRALPLVRLNKIGLRHDGKGAPANSFVC